MYVLEMSTIQRNSASACSTDEWETDQFTLLDWVQANDTNNFMLDEDFFRRTYETLP